MKVAKRSNFIGSIENEERLLEYLNNIDDDIRDLFLFSQGRVSFGSATSGDKGENLSGEFVEFTTSATPDAENTISHTMGVIPLGFTILWQDKAGSLYQGPTTGTNWTSSNVYLRCDVASVTFKIFLIK